MPLLLMLAGGSLRPGPGPARSWLERELSHPEYHESLLHRFQSWLADVWASLRASAAGASPLSTAAAVVLVVVLVVLVALVVARVRREPLRALGSEPALGTGLVDPQVHRDAAAVALASGAYDLAVVEAFRAVAGRAVRRGVLEESPGRTPHELAADLAPAFPAYAEALDRASTLFDLVFYGDQLATLADARSLLDLDDALRFARPGVTPAERLAPTSPVPR